MLSVIQVDPSFVIFNINVYSLALEVIILQST